MTATSVEKIIFSVADMCILKEIEISVIGTSIRLK